MSLQPDYRHPVIDERRNPSRLKLRRLQRDMERKEQRRSYVRAGLLALIILAGAAGAAATSVLFLG